MSNGTAFLLCLGLERRKCVCPMGMPYSALDGQQETVVLRPYGGELMEGGLSNRTLGVMIS